MEVQIDPYFATRFLAISVLRTNRLLIDHRWRAGDAVRP